MKDIPFIVIIPAYQAAEHLERSVGSVTAQAGDCQVVVVDDGSADQTYAVAQRLARENIAVHALSQPNGGQLAARTAGIRYAREHLDTDGAYFLFLDADDAFVPDALSRLRALLREHPCDMLLFDVARIHAQTGRETERFGGSGSGMVRDKAALYRIVLFDMHYNSLCRKAIAARCVGDRDYAAYTHLRHGEDLVQSLDYYKAADAVYFSDACLYRYYTNPASVTKSVSLEKYPVESTARALTWDFVREENVWSQRELDDYAAFLLTALEGKLKEITLFDAPFSQKKEKFDHMRRDAFYGELLQRELPHDRVITLFAQENYPAMMRAVKCKRLFGGVKRKLIKQ